MKKRKEKGKHKSKKKGKRIQKGGKGYRKKNKKYKMNKMKRKYQSGKILNLLLILKIQNHLIFQQILGRNQQMQELYTPSFFKNKKRLKNSNLQKIFPI